MSWIISHAISAVKSETPHTINITGKVIRETGKGSMAGT